MNRILLSITLALSITLPALAIKGYPHPITYTQPDGSTLTVYIKGNREQKMLISEDGNLLVTLPDGECRYAVRDGKGGFTASGIKASDLKRRGKAETEFLKSGEAIGIAEAVSISETTAQSLRKSNVGLCRPWLNAMGKVRTLVILCNFNNTQFTVEDPKQFFSDMLNSEGFSEYGATGSVRDYFVSNSNGAFEPVFDVVGPVDLPNSRFYYGRNSGSGNELHAHEMIIDAANLIDDEVDFSEYDTDGDGYVDNVYVIYAGKGEADTGQSANVWPHSWELMKADTKNIHEYDGVVLNQYACTNEWAGQYPRPAGIGTFIHEFGHVIGLPDLYTTIYNDAFTPGEWSAMDSGPYNNEGRTPPYYSSFERYALGWLEPQELLPGNISIEPLGSSNHAYIVYTGNDNEYFLFENRQQEGYDAYLPGHGMLIWHIDFDENIWEDNVVNNDPKHQRVDLIEADGDERDDTRDTDSFPSVIGLNSFTPETTPSFLCWDGNPASVSLENITETACNIECRVVSADSGVSASAAQSGNWYSVSGRCITTTLPATLYTFDAQSVATGTKLEAPIAGLYILKSSAGENVKLIIP